MLNITYRFKFPDNSQINYPVQVDSANLDITDNNGKHFPDWTALEFHQCPHCPLQGHEVIYCPLAARLSPLVSLFHDVISYQTISLEVITTERIITQETTAQRAVSSLMGIIIACCGCPYTGYFKPMARFHLPLSGKEETIYRSASMYLMAQYFRSQAGKRCGFSLKGLEMIYANMQTVNTYLVKRLRQASRADSNINAVILLDAYAMAIPFVLDESLEEIRHLFASYLNDG